MNNLLPRDTPVYTTFAQALCACYPAREAQTIARWFLEDRYQLRPEQIPTWSASTWTRCEQDLQRLLTHEPWQYVVGEADFYGLKFFVNPAVLIPRPETEELVAHIIETHKGQRDLRILDVGTGTGCIPITLAKNLKDATFAGCDISAEALVLAQKNAERHNVSIDWQEVDILLPENWSKFEKIDILVSNPPYIKEEEAPTLRANVLNYEPTAALFVTDGDALQFYKAIADCAQRTLKPKGMLYFETHFAYAKDVSIMLQDKGFEEVKVLQDMQGLDRIVQARWLCA